MKVRSIAHHTVVFLALFAATSVLVGMTYSPSTNMIVEGSIADGSVTNDESIRVSVTVTVNGTPIGSLTKILAVSQTLQFNSTLEAEANPGDLIVVTVKDLDDNFLDDHSMSVVQPS